MLVLSRKSGEAIQISDDITLTVSRVRGGRVRLSIEAPKNIRILRKEVAAAEDVGTNQVIVVRGDAASGANHLIPPSNGPVRGVEPPGYV